MRLALGLWTVMWMACWGCTGDITADGGTGMRDNDSLGPVFAGTAGVAGAVPTGGTGGGVNAGSGGVGATGGASGTGATGGSGGVGATGGASGAGATGGSGGTGGSVEELEPFSFFVTSLEVMRELSGSQDGFGGDFGGLEGADMICQQAADRVGFGAKTWRAFLSATDGGNGSPVHAKDRIGTGPWYDRNGRLVAEDLDGLLQSRPDGDAQTINDLPNEFGEGLMAMGDTHDVLTGTNAQGMLDNTALTSTCNDWTSVDAVPGSGGGSTGGFGGFGGGGGGTLRVGHSWPANSGMNWMTAHTARSCKPGVNLLQNGAGDGSSVGAGGGWGAIYCFALQP